METIAISRYTKALLDNYQKIKVKAEPDEASGISVSQTVSFLAIVYERLRNIVEYRESHLIRRASIERILRRRLSMNPEGKGEAENLIRELLWARYFPNESLGTQDVEHVQNLIDKYLYIKSSASKNINEQDKSYMAEFLIQLLTCEIEERLSPDEAQKNSLYAFYIYQVLKDKVRVEGISEDQKNASFYVAVETAYSKSDLPYLRYHIFLLGHRPLSYLTHEDAANITPHLLSHFKKVDSVIHNPYSDKMRRFVTGQVAPFHILFEILKRRDSKTLSVLNHKEYLRKDVDFFCQEKYAQTQSRFQSLALKAIIYIFLTKMLFAFLIEYPVSIYLYGTVDYSSLAINSLFPPLLMFLIVTLTQTPDKNNTRRIFDRIINIIDWDTSFEKSVSFSVKKQAKRQSFRIFFFTMFYLLTFIITFGFLHRILLMLKYHIVSEIIFVFFVSLVSFFAYRIRQTAKEYQLKEKESFFRPFVDLFSVPVLSTGKFLSRSLSKINIFTVFFDFIFEAPFKLIIEIFEEWISFVRSKRDEIV